MGAPVLASRCVLPRVPGGSFLDFVLILLGPLRVRLSLRGWSSRSLGLEHLVPQLLRRYVLRAYIFGRNEKLPPFRKIDKYPSASEHARDAGSELVPNLRGVTWGGGCVLCASVLRPLLLQQIGFEFRLIDRRNQLPSNPALRYGSVDGFVESLCPHTLVGAMGFNDFAPPKATRAPALKGAWGTALSSMYLRTGAIPKPKWVERQARFVCHKFPFLGGHFVRYPRPSPRRGQIGKATPIKHRRERAVWFVPRLWR